MIDVPGPLAPGSELQTHVLLCTSGSMGTLEKLSPKQQALQTSTLATEPSLQPQTSFSKKQEACLSMLSSWYC